MKVFVRILAAVAFLLGADTGDGGVGRDGGVGTRSPRAGVAAVPIPDGTAAEDRGLQGPGRTGGTAGGWGPSWDRGGGGGGAGGHTRAGGGGAGGAGHTRAGGQVYAPKPGAVGGA